MATFDFDAYKRQCLTVADAYQKWSKGTLDDQAYQAILADLAMVSAKAIAKIELEVIHKGDQFRPIDAYQF